MKNKNNKKEVPIVIIDSLSLTSEQLDRYEKMFYNPECIVVRNGKNYVAPLSEDHIIEA